MARRKIRPTPPDHIIIVDSNILWHEDKSLVVSPEFQQFWDDNSQRFPMKLIIPSVVRGELLYQQTTSALKLLNGANKNIEKIGTITQKTYSHRISEARVKKEVARRFDNWINKVDAEIRKSPIEDIDWNQMIENSVWRILPFTPDAKNPRNEKGFRDALILETVQDICSSYHGDFFIAFICSDYPLRTASEKKLHEYDKFSCYESLKTFSSFIELTQQDLTNEFVKLILSKARKKFYDNTDNCISTKDQIFKKIYEDKAYSAKLNSPPDISSLFNSLSGSSVATQPSGPERIWIVAPEFDKLEGRDTFHWISEIRMVRHFISRPLAPVLPGSTPPEERLRILQIAVNWSADVKADARFFNCRVNRTSESGYSFEPSTPDEARRYGLDTGEARPKAD